MSDFKTRDFWYDLPEELIAQTPLKQRDGSRLLCIDKQTGALEHRKFSDIIEYLNEGDCVYFVHSFYAKDCEDSLLATTEYDKELTAIVGKGNVMGCQFHPERSGEIGLNILRAFCEM